MIETSKEWVGHVSIPIRYQVDGPIIGHVVDLYPDGTGKCLMVDGTVDTMKLFHVASMSEALEYRLLVEGIDTVPTITVEDSPGGPIRYNGKDYKLVREPHDTSPQG